MCLALALGYCIVMGDTSINVFSKLSVISARVIGRVGLFMIGGGGLLSFYCSSR